MQVDRGLPRDWPKPARPAVLTIGSFDGVHRGHRALLDATLKTARDLDALATVLTFDPHPRCVVTPNCPAMLTTVEERTDLLARAGIGRVVVLPFTRDVSEWTAAQFCDELLSGLDLRAIAIGSDFAFGFQRQGNVEFLSRWGGGNQVAIHPVELVGDGEPVSSTRVRQAVAEGDVAGADGLMGHPYFIDAVVVRGNRVGNTLGYPTANLDVSSNKLLPDQGVYAGWLAVDGEWFACAISVGDRPTFGGGELVVEAFVLDFKGDLYGKRLRCAFAQRVREQRAYPDADALARQIGQDVDEIRSLLSQIDAPDTI